jgi:hypothetical protein
MTAPPSAAYVVTEYADNDDWIVSKIYPFPSLAPAKALYNDLKKDLEEYMECSTPEQIQELLNLWWTFEEYNVTDCIQLWCTDGDSEYYHFTCQRIYANKPIDIHY